MTTTVDIVLDGVLFGGRTWSIIPRVGELVLLKNGKIWAEVTQVIWGSDTRTPLLTNNQWIQLICKTVTSPIVS